MLFGKQAGRYAEAARHFVLSGRISIAETTDPLQGAGICVYLGEFSFLFAEISHSTF